MWNDVTMITEFYEEKWNYYCKTKSSGELIINKLNNSSDECLLKLSLEF